MNSGNAGQYHLLHSIKKNTELKGCEISRPKHLHLKFWLIIIKYTARKNLASNVIGKWITSNTAIRDNWESA